MPYSEKAGREQCISQAQEFVGEAARRLRVPVPTIKEVVTAGSGQSKMSGICVHDEASIWIAGDYPFRSATEYATAVSPQISCWLTHAVRSNSGLGWDQGILFSEVCEGCGEIVHVGYPEDPGKLGSDVSRVPANRGSTDASRTISKLFCLSR
jgi:hypothetical protein